MSVVDIVLILAAVVFAVTGYRNGVIVGVLSFAGFLGGGIVGMLITPWLVGDWAPGAGQTVAAVAIVLLAALLGQLLAGLVASRLRSLVTWTPARFIDSTLGAAVSVVALLIVAWFVASALRAAPLPSVAREIGDSKVITTVDRLMPDASRDLFVSFRDLLDESRFPRVFAGLQPERILPVQPPTPGVVQSPGIRSAADSVVRITGDAVCDSVVEGSGFVYAPRHVLTNAHVVAGVSRPRVEVAGRGERLTARVVAFDPGRDLAVLYVPDLSAPALRFEPGAGRGDAAVVAGFPGGGPYRLGPARIRAEINAQGTGIYGRDEVTREVYSLLATVRPGNSGGPLLSPQGRVYGVVFAKSLDDDNTGYALTAAEAAPVANEARASTERVPTGDCAQ